MRFFCKKLLDFMKRKWYIVINRFRFFSCKMDIYMDIILDEYPLYLRKEAECHFVMRFMQNIQTT